jgi:hypothetical protein
MKRSALVLLALLLAFVPGVVSGQDIDLFGSNKIQAGNPGVDLFGRLPATAIKAEEPMPAGFDLLAAAPKKKIAVEGGKHDRVLLFVDLSHRVVRKQVCYGSYCRFEDVNEAISPQSAEIIARLKAVETPNGSVWSVSDRRDAYFQVVDIGRPESASLAATYKPDAIPMAVKLQRGIEFSRKAVGGMSGVELCRWWLEPTSPAAAESQTVRRWTYPGNIRQHLTDASQPHGLSPELIKGWTDQQCIDWHDRHHEWMERQKFTASTQSIADDVHAIAKQVLAEEVSAIRGTHPLVPRDRKSDPG